MRAKIWSLLFLVGLSAGAQAATNFWDAATNAGYQHGDGNWSTNAADTNWTSAGIAPRTTWTNGDSANFNSTLAGSSCVMVSGVVTAGAVSIVGSYYSLNITNGGVICITNGMSIGTIVANNPNSSNVVRVIGGAGVTSVWNNGMTSFALSGRPSKGNTFIVDGAGVAGSAVATNMGDLSVGISDNTDVSVIVTNKGELHVRGVIRLGGGRAETNISLTIAMGGILRTTNNTSLGWKPTNGPGLDVVTNTLIVRDAGSLFDGGGARLTLADFSGGGLLISHWNTRMILDGGMITNVSFGCGVDNSVGQYFRQNEFSSFILVTNGGRMYCGAAYSTLFHMVGPLNYVRNNNDLVTGMNTLWNNGGKALWYTFNSRVELACSDNAMTLDDGALMTNVGAFSFASGGTVNNQFVITNGARLFSTNGLIGAVAPATSNKFVVTGSRSGTNSLWDLGGGSLQIGAAASVNNSLTIDQGGRVDNVGTLTIYGTNYVYLLGGALASSNMIQTNGLLFTVGDGFQVATLKLMGGFGTFTSGLLVQSNATLLAGGAITGGVYGVSVTNGATFSPGSSGVGALTIGGSNLTWGAGATYVCEIANFVGGAGVGYDTINVSSQLALVADVGSSSLVIRISSMGALAANFVTNATYNLLVASSASLAGFDSTKFTVNTDDFLNTVDGTWGVMSLNNGLYVTYSPLSETGLACTWAAPTNGNWTVGVNWLGGTPPSASSPEMQLTFGGSASESAYSATNDNAGNFQLNRLVLNNANAAVTNRLAGNPMQFWNADAAIEQSGSGSFIVSNVLNTVTGLVFRGTGAGSLTIASNITVAGSMVVQGAGTVFMNGSNSYLGPLLVNAPGGILQLNNLNALPTNSLVVSNGTLRVPSVLTTFGNSACYRFALVSGSGSLWTNGSALTIGSNAQVTVDAGGTLSIGGALIVSNMGPVANGLIVTNGGKLFSTAASFVGNASSNNSMLVAGGGALWNGGAVALTIGNSATAINNLLRLDGQGAPGGAVVTNLSTLTVGAIAGADRNGLIVGNGGRLFTGGAAIIGNTGSSGNYARVEGTTGAMWNAGGQTLTIGYHDAKRNTLTIDGKGVLGGAILTNVSSLRIGYDATVSGLLTANNSVLVTNGGVVYLGAGPHGIGFNNTQLNSTSNNILEIVQGGRVFSTGLIKVGSIGDYSGFHYDNQLVIRDADSVLNLGNSDLIVGWCSTGGNAVFLRRSWVLCDGGLITNVGAVTIGFAGSSMMLADNNRIVVTNGGRFYNRGAIQVGGGFASNNLMTITGTNSLWDMGGYNLTVGAYQLAKSNTANSVFIDQGGTLDNIGTLTVYTNSFANLCGGTLGVANTLYTNGLFIVGDGAQAATLKALAGGTLAFNSGLLITNNATLSGVGTVAGGPTGVLVTNGATIAPGLSGAGTLTIGGSNLTWSAGGTYICEITNLNKAAGIGWDLVNVSSQLVLNGSGLVIKMDSLGAAAANFDATRDYNLRILNYGSQVGFDPANFSINTNAFMGSVVPWTVTNANNSLWLVYRGSGVTYPPSSTWNAPTSGNWNVNGNWTPSGQPANDGSAKLEFGGSGAAYASTNNLGTFLLNQLLLTGSSGASVTNVIGGSTLVFTNSAALVDYSGSATYLITNKLQAATTLVFGGPGYGGTVTIQSNIVATGGLTKQGPWTLELKNLNTFGGTVVVDSPIQDGVLKVANNNGLGAGSAVIVSNGTLWTAMATGDYYFASTASGNNRQGLITGNGSVWNNSAGIFNVGGINATNVSLIVADGGMLSMSSTLTIGRNNASYNSLIVTNGGRLSCSGAVLAISSSADRNTLLVTGSNSVCDLGGSLTISSSGAYNMLLVDQGGLATNCGAIIFGNASAGGQLVVANGGRVYASSLTFMNASGSFAGSLLITGSNSLLQAGGVSKLARFAGRGNRAVVDQRGTITNLSWTLADAGDGISNSVIVATGGRMFCNAQSIICTGSRNTNNTISISGAGSLWDNGGKHLIVANGQTNVWNANTWNGICIAAGGTMTNVATLNLANTNSPGSSSNYVTVTDGTLQADTLTSSNDLPQYLTIDGQSLVTITNALVATNIAVFLNGGMLSAKNMTFNNGAPFIVGGLDTFLIDTDGVAKLTSKVTPQAATLSLLTGGSSVFSNGLVITNLASLTGSGLIVATSTVYGTLSPGAGIGVITNSGDLILKASATTKIEIATNSTAGAGWDLLTVTNGTLNLGGNLNVVLTGGFTPLNAQSFVVMTNLGPLSVSDPGSAFGSQQAAVYTNASLSGTPAGRFKVAVGTKGVTLYSYSLWQPSGSMIIIR